MSEPKFKSVNHGLPYSLSQIDFVLNASSLVRAETLTKLEPLELDLKVLGTSLNTLYQAATCHRKCHGGGHLLESICGRAFNQSIGAIQLLLLGLYDEALNLTRGVGEAYHYVVISAVDKKWLRDWLICKQERIGSTNLNRVRCGSA